MYLELEQGVQGQKTEIKWCDRVNDLWEKRLPHLRKEMSGEVYDLTTADYGFKDYGFKYSATSDELPASSLREAIEEEEKEQERLENLKLSDPSTGPIKEEPAGTKKPNAL